MSRKNNVTGEKVKFSGSDTEQSDDSQFELLFCFVLVMFFYLFIYLLR